MDSDKYKQLKERLAQARAVKEENNAERVKVKNETQRVKNQERLNRLNKQKAKSGNIVKKLSKVVGYKKELASNLTKDFMSQSQSGGTKRVGRPQGYRTHTSPFSGKPIPATQFYKEMRLFRRQQQVLGERINEQRLQNAARQGVTPQQLQQINMQRQMMQQQIQQNPNMQMPQNNQNVPIRPQIQNQSIWNRRNQPPQVMRDWDLFGTKIVERGSVHAMWN